MEAELAPDRVKTIRSFNELVTALDSSGISRWVAKQIKSTDRQARFKEDCTVLRARLKKRRSFINPRSSRIQYWDLATGLALIYTAIVTPYEVTVGLKSEIGLLFAINTVVNVIFIIDIVIQFVLPVYDKHTKQHIRDHKELAKRYMSSWFLLDVFTVLPFDTVTLAAPDIFGASDACEPGSETLIKGIKLVRILRLFKLLRSTLRPPRCPPRPMRGRTPHAARRTPHAARRTPRGSPDAPTTSAPPPPMPTLASAARCTQCFEPPGWSKDGRPRSRSPRRLAR